METAGYYWEWKSRQPVWPSSFEHAPLEADHIRLLEVDFDSRGEDVRFTVHQYPRNAAPEYQAISYTWGESPHVLKEIMLDNKPYPVTQNAYWCLRFIAQHYRQWKYLWMDSVCINQKDLTERNHQVRAMALVYRNASLVLAWLGSDREIMRNEWTIARNHIFSNEWSWRDSPYWWRIWIIQELYCARDIIFLYGAQHFPWQSLLGKSQQWADFDLSMGDRNSHGMRQVLDLLGYDQGQIAEGPVQDRKTVSLCEAGHRFSKSGCQDNRDKLYAVLNLLPPHEAEALSRYFPDYKISHSKYVLISVCHCLLWYHGNLDKLNHALSTYYLQIKGTELELVDNVAGALVMYGRTFRRARLQLCGIDSDIGIDDYPAGLVISDVLVAVKPLWRRISRPARLSSSTKPLHWWTALREQLLNRVQCPQSRMSAEKEYKAQEELMHQTIALADCEMRAARLYSSNPSDNTWLRHNRRCFGASIWYWKLMGYIHPSALEVCQGYALRTFGRLRIWTFGYSLPSPDPNLSLAV